MSQSQNHEYIVDRIVSALGITKAELAIRLGITKQAISNWKNTGIPSEHFRGNVSLLHQCHCDNQEHCKHPWRKTTVPRCHLQRCEYWLIGIEILRARMRRNWYLS